MTQIEERLEEEARAQFEKEIIDGRIDLYDAASDDFVELGPNIIFEED